MNWPKLVQRIQEDKSAELKKLVRPWHKKVQKALEHPPIDADRIRFLEKVEQSLEGYLDPDKSAEVEYPLYYLLLYYLEDDKNQFYTTIDTNDLVHLVSDDTTSTKVIAYMVNQFRNPLLTGSHHLTLEPFLSYILQK